MTLGAPWRSQQPHDRLTSTFSHLRAASHVPAASHLRAARALMLTADERDYLFRVAGESPPQVPRPSREISPGIRHLLDSMPGTPAYVLDAASNVLAWNPLATTSSATCPGTRTGT